MDFEDNPDDVSIKEELVNKIAETVEYEKYGGADLGNVDEILSEDLVSIEIKNNKINILKGNKLIQYRTYYYGYDHIDMDDMFDRELDDIHREVEFVKDNPLYIVETDCQGCYGEYPYDKEIKPENIEYLLEEYLKFCNTRIDSLKNYRSILKEPYINHGNRKGTSAVFKTFTLEVVKVTDTHIIAKIIDKNAPFIIPKVHDLVYLIVD